MNATTHFCLVAPAADPCRAAADALEEVDPGARCLIVDSPEALDRLVCTHQCPDLVLISHETPWSPLPELITRLRCMDPGLPILVISADNDTRAAVSAIKAGATDFISLCRGREGLVPAISQALDRPHAASAASLEQQLRDLQNEQQRRICQERLAAMAEMSSGIAHDFNNSLCVIQGFVELLLLRPSIWDDRAKVRHYLDMIHKTTADTTNVVQRLRSFYRRQGGGLQTVLTVDRLVSHVLEKRQLAFKEAGIRVHCHIADRILVRGCWEELNEAVSLLVDNAIEAMPEGGILTIDTEIEDHDVHLKVIDTGCGMGEEARRRCLEPFYTTKDVGSKGLGLSTVFGTSIRHGGELTVDSALNQGTTVTLRLPLCQHDAHIVDTAGSVAWSGASPLDLLVVDDSDAVCEVVRELLQEQGHRVTTCASATAALDAWRTGSYDLLLTDRDMPGISGEELATTIRRADPALPIIMITGRAPAAGEALPAGIDAVISKPIDFRHLSQEMLRLTATAGGPVPHEG